MSVEYIPHPYQLKGTAHILDDNVQDTQSRGCFFTVGTGKSVMSLTALDFLLNMYYKFSIFVLLPCRAIEDFLAFKWGRTGTSELA